MNPPTLSLKKRILFMDDEREIRELTAEMLDYLGYDVTVVKNGEEAIKIFNAVRQSGSRFDVIILDLIVRDGLGGRETIRELLQIDPNLKVIASSGYSNDSVMSDFRQFGFCGTIAKPYTLENLAAALSQHLHPSPS